MESKQFTIVFIVDNENQKVLLAKKRYRCESKRNFGVDLYNGYGGKLRKRKETKEECAVRELQEESNLDIREEHLNYLGYLDVIRQRTKQSIVHLFTVEKEAVLDLTALKTTDEMEKGRWFPISEIPYREMWPDAQFWMPRILAGEILKISFEYFDDELLEESLTIEPIMGYNREYNNNY